MKWKCSSSLPPFWSFKRSGFNAAPSFSYYCVVLFLPCCIELYFLWTSLEFSSLTENLLATNTTLVLIQEGKLSGYTLFLVFLPVCDEFYSLMLSYRFNCVCLQFLLHNICSFLYWVSSSAASVCCLSFTKGRNSFFRLLFLSSPKKIV